jgi:diphthamide biosynthesis enzyme Dph1/Dph2-like protein
MKVLFVEATSKKKFDSGAMKDLENLPKNIVIAYSIQYKNLAKEIKDKLSKTHNVLKVLQVLGCSKPNLPKNTSAILLIGEAKFHAVSLYYETGIQVYLLENNKLTKISRDEVNKLEKRKRGAELKFLNSKNVGIIVSTKPGQERLEKAIKFSKSLKNKKSYLFLSNNINEKEFENFEINSWVNSSCPRLDMNTPILNISYAERLNFGD